MPLQHAVLGLLAKRASYGYELKASFERAIGPQWGELNIGHLYQILDRLVRDGLVTREVISQRERPDKTVYRLTETGRDELARWISTPATRQGGYRDEFFLKLLVASGLGADQLRTIVRTQREAYLLELRSLTELQLQHREQPLVALLIEAALLHTRANLQVVERAGDDAERIAGAAMAHLGGDAAEGAAEGAGEGGSVQPRRAR
jgi:DNA-binding PadR family transcriptional regulator